MAPRTDPLRDVLSAAQILLERREDEMVTAVEWDALKAAVDAATQTRPDDRKETFAVEDGWLVRRVIPKRGKPYDHRCSLDTFREVLFTGEELAAGGFTLEEVVDQTNLPSSQVATALAFLRERGCLDVRHRRNFPVDRFLYEDGMIEFHALGQDEHQ